MTASWAALVLSTNLTPGALVSPPLPLVGRVFGWMGQADRKQHPRRQPLIHSVWTVVVPTSGLLPLGTGHGSHASQETRMGHVGAGCKACKHSEVGSI